MSNYLTEKSMHKQAPVLDSDANTFTLTAVSKLHGTESSCTSVGPAEQC